MNGRDTIITIVGNLTADPEMRYKERKYDESANNT